jgi:hypothetical protein
LRQQFNSKRYNIVSKGLSSHCLVAPAADEVKVERAVPCALLNSGGEAALFGIVRRSGRSTFKNRPPEKIRAVRDLIESKVKTLLKTLN